MSNFNTTLSASEQKQYDLDLLTCGSMPSGIGRAYGARLIVINRMVGVHRKHRQYANAIADAERAFSMAKEGVVDSARDVSRASTANLSVERDYLAGWLNRLDDAEKQLQDCRFEASTREQTSAELVC